MEFLLSVLCNVFGPVAPLAPLERTLSAAAARAGVVAAVLALAARGFSLNARLELRSFSFGTGGISCGSFGTGGAAPSPPADWGRPGEGLRNVLSVIDPELLCLSKLPLERPLVALPEPALDDLLCMRLVCTSPTSVGGGDIVRRAAAAAEADRLP